MCRPSHIHTTASGGAPFCDACRTPHPHHPLMVQLHPRPIFTRLPLALPVLPSEGSSDSVESEVLLTGMALATKQKQRCEHKVRNNSVGKLSVESVNVYERASSPSKLLN